MNPSNLSNPFLLQEDASTNVFQSFKSYRQVATQTASPGQLIVMLYEGAINSLERAMQGFEKDDPLEANLTVHNNVTHAQNIILELNSSLNMAAGGDFAVTMRRLYDYMDERLSESNLRKDPAGVREVVNRLIVLRDAWVETLHKQPCLEPVPA
ncbi:MAG: flagellar export chaperone FliS [Verrucomicrobia bacterium]|nr:flagellar export chaperone FliS [Verrucomicrobiota bacterium]